MGKKSRICWQVNISFDEDGKVKKVSKQCLTCKKQFYVKPSRSKTAKYCSNECRYEYYRNFKVKGNSPAWKGGKIIKKCQYCSKTFYVRPCRENTAKFCSKKCQYEFFSKNYIRKSAFNWQGGKVNKKCEVCEKEFKVRKSIANTTKYCSIECQNKGMEKKVTKVCEGCEKNFKVIFSEKDKRKFCSQTCYNKYGAGLSKEKHWNWQGGISQEYGEEWTEKLKETIRDRDSRKCQKCGCLESKNNEKLNIHHIDCSKDNHNPDNLISLCRSCHMTIHNKNKEVVYE